MIRSIANRRLLRIFLISIIIALFFIISLPANTFLSDKKSLINMSSTLLPNTTDAITTDYPSLTSTPYPKDFPQISVSIDQVKTFSDRYFIKGSLNQSDISNGVADRIDVSNMVLTDFNAKQIPIEPIDFALSDDPRGLEFSFSTESKGAQEPLTLIVSSVNFHIEGISSRPFEIDFGNDPRENQEWSVNEDFDLAGRHIYISTVKARTTDNILKLEFTITGNPDVTGVYILDSSMQSIDSETFFSSVQNGKIISLLRYTGAFPTGKHQFTVDLVSFAVRGSWQVSFDPKSIDTSPSSENSELHNACFLNENWVSQETLPTEIPAELSGTLLIDNAFIGSDSLFTATINLKGSEKQNILPWQPITFSPDGTMMINYDWQIQTAHIINLYNGEVKEYAWSKDPSNRISWLDNTELIAYDSDDGIYISHVDGTGIYKVNETDSETLLSGWLPDGQHLLVSRKSYKKPMLLQIMDVNNGETKDLFSFSSGYITAAVPSPDGKKVLFEDGVKGTQQTGIFIANLDGSERHLIASFWRMLIGSYTWSPDGKWVIISITDVKHDSEITSFLINPDSCETIRLSTIDWSVRAWGPKQ